MTLASILDSVNRGSVAEALDILVMRIHTLQRAKIKGGTWEAAQRLELIPGAATELLPAGLSSALS